ncbi:MAG TPA: DsrE family protein [Hyphomicrobiaceae bacterium]|nr:DsrE family protein [Hyphomicrobiaceae bacterium]
MLKVISKRTLLSFGVMAPLLGMVVLAAPAAAQDSRYGKVKVVYHLNGDSTDGKAYKQALGNIRNHIAAVGKDNADIKVVMHGDGVNILRLATTDMALQGTIADLKTSNKVAFLVCKNTLVQRKIDPDKDLFDVNAEDIVPSGVAEVAHLQTKGYSYLKP